jgi:hypothetical protein
MRLRMLLVAPYSPPHSVFGGTFDAERAVLVPPFFTMIPTPGIGFDEQTGSFASPWLTVATPEDVRAVELPGFRFTTIPTAGIGFDENCGSSPPPASSPPPLGPMRALLEPGLRFTTMPTPGIGFEEQTGSGPPVNGLAPVVSLVPKPAR